MNRTSIEWCDFSANPLKYRDETGRVVWACVHASQGCTHCYAESLAKRYRKGGRFNVPTTANVTPFLDEQELRRMLTYKPASTRRCFVGDMTDVFGEWVPDELIDRLFAVFFVRRDITWQVLTKRAARMRDYFAAPHRTTAIDDSILWLMNSGVLDASVQCLIQANGPEPWPLPNVWLGASVEDQQRADERIPDLLQTPAAIRFVSAEPLLGPIAFKRRQLGQGADCDECQIRDVRIDEDGCCLGCGSDAMFYGLDWVIVGGESGPGARPMNVEWAESIVQQCRAENVPCFVKQLGANPFYPYSDGTPFSDLDLKSRKGSDMAEWPESLRVREFPRADEKVGA